MAKGEAPARREAISVSWPEVSLWAGVAVASVLIAITVLGLWDTSWSVPLTYRLDALTVQAQVKGMIDNGWVTRNAYLGAPGQQSLTAFPTTEMLQLIVLKLLTMVSHDVGLVVNLYYLLTYPLIALAALAVMRVFRVGRPAAAVGALLYAFLPYHYMRGELHLALAAYFMVPLAMMVALWVWSRRPPLYAPGDDDAWRFTITAPRTIVALVICFLVGFDGVYYAAFAGFFIAGSAVIVALVARAWRQLVGPAVLVAVIVLGSVLATLPYTLAPDRGQVPPVASRSPVDSQIFGLKLADLFLPVPGHRIPALAAIPARYRTALNAVAWQLDTESETTALGLIGAAGLLFLFLWLPVAAVRGPTIKLASRALFTQLSSLAIWGVLLATSGGFATVISLLVPNQIRAYNRISVFIAFAALFAVALLLDALFRRFGETSLLVWVIAVMVVLFGVLDQTTPNLVTPFAQSQSRAQVVAAYTSDTQFVGQMQSALRPGTAVFQLPYVPFPEAGMTQALPDYEHLRGYLHSTNLRWSYGAMKGSPDASWAEQTAALPPDQMVAALKQRGFGAVWFDERGYGSSAQATYDALAKALGNPVAIDADNLRAVWAIR